MSEQPSTKRLSERRQPGSRVFWLIPSVTFLVGLLLGAIVIGVTNSSEESVPDAEASVSPQPSPTSRADLEVTVPGTCLDAVEAAEQGFQLARDGISAVTELNSARLEEVLAELQRAEPEIRRLAEQCRSRAAEAAAS